MIKTAACLATALFVVGCQEYVKSRPFPEGPAEKITIREVEGPLPAGRYIEVEAVATHVVDKGGAIGLVLDEKGAATFGKELSHAWRGKLEVGDSLRVRGLTAETVGTSYLVYIANVEYMARLESASSR